MVKPKALDRRDVDPGNADGHLSTLGRATAGLAGP
jgi:hypothetical protein